MAKHTFTAIALASLTALGACVITPAQADTGYYRFETCLTLKHECDGDAAGFDPPGSIFACGGYVKGVMDQITVFRATNNSPPCFPQMTAEQTILITKRWMAANPQWLHLPAAVCINLAVGEAFPACHQ